MSCEKHIIHPECRCKDRPQSTNTMKCKICGTIMILCRNCSGKIKQLSSRQKDVFTNSPTLHSFHSNEWEKISSQPVINQLPTPVTSISNPSSQVIIKSGVSSNTLDSVQGPQGLQGYEGKRGLPGPQGSIGQPGKDGPQGVAGENGMTGPQGSEGKLGPQGRQGLMGFQGPEGQVKYVDREIIGPQGPEGKPGPPGAKGSSSSSMIIGGITMTVPNNGDYIGLFGFVPNNNHDAIYQFFPVAGRIEHLQFVLTNPPGINQWIQFTIVKNGEPTDISLKMENNTKTGTLLAEIEFDVDEPFAIQVHRSDKASVGMIRWTGIFN
jgi:hypothetical protein